MCKSGGGTGPVIPALPHGKMGCRDRRIPQKLSGQLAWRTQHRNKRNPASNKDQYLRLSSDLQATHIRARIYTHARTHTLNEQKSQTPGLTFREETEGELPQEPTMYPFAALPHLYTRHIWNTDSNTLRDQNDVRQKTGQTFRLATTLLLITDIERQASI